MAKIDLVSEVMRHNDEEIIDFLSTTVSSMRGDFIKASKAQRPELLYGLSTNLDIIYGVITALDRRNKEHSLK